MPAQTLLPFPAVSTRPSQVTLADCEASSLEGNSARSLSLSSPCGVNQLGGSFYNGKPLPFGVRCANFSVGPSRTAEENLTHIILK